MNKGEAIHTSTRPYHVAPRCLLIHTSTCSYHVAPRCLFIHTSTRSYHVASRCLLIHTFTHICHVAPRCRRATHSTMTCWRFALTTAKSLTQRWCLATSRTGKGVKGCGGVGEACEGVLRSWQEVESSRKAVEGLKRGVEGCGGVEAGPWRGVEGCSGAGERCGGAVEGVWTSVHPHSPHLHVVSCPFLLPYSSPLAGTCPCAPPSSHAQAPPACCLMLSPRAILHFPAGTCPCAPPRPHTQAPTCLMSHAPLPGALLHPPAGTCLCALPHPHAYASTYMSHCAPHNPAGTCRCAPLSSHAQAPSCMFHAHSSCPCIPPPRRDLPLCTPSLKDLATLLLQKEIRQR